MKTSGIFLLEKMLNEIFNTNRAAFDILFYVIQSVPWELGYALRF